MRPLFSAQVLAQGPVRIRKMEKGDLNRVLEIAASLPAAPQWPWGAYAAAIEQDAAVRRVALAAEESGRVEGFAIASVVADEADLESIAVAGEAQGRGIGAALVAALIAQLQAAQAKDIRLEVRESNRIAARLYARAGFVEAGRRAGYYREPAEDAVILRLELA